MNWHVGQKVTETENGQVTALCSITRLTKTLVTLENGERYRVIDGKPLGQPDPWHVRFIRPTVKEDKNFLVKKDLAHYLSHSVIWARLSLEALQDIEKRIQDDLSK